MFERFTASARGTVVRAQQEAADADDGCVGTEHVVIALAQDEGVAGEVLRAAGVTAQTLRRRRLEDSRDEDDHGGRLDADALRSLGIDLDDVRRSVEETFGAGALDNAPSRPGRRRWPASSHIPFSRRAKASLERGLRQAIMNGDTRIGSEHLLLGILDEGTGAGVRLLRDEGLDLAQLRATTLERSRRSA
jgi:ATP-dependent Clp protease ATP-binding subunit ClpA